jgi:hypothetical protein
MPCYILKIVNHTFNFVMVFSYWICRLGFLVSYVFSCSVLQTSRGELVQGKNCWFFLHALIWCLCIDWNCSSWGNDTLLVRVICKNYIPQQLIDIYDGELHFVYTFVVESSCSNPSLTRTLIYLFQVYVWSKQNPFIHMSFLGLFTFTAAYLPWVRKL